MPPMLADYSDEIADIVQTRAQFVVRIEGRDQHASSGVIWSREGFIITANYTVEFDDDLVVGLPNGERVPAKLVGRDAACDLALLHIDVDEILAPSWTRAESLRLGHVLMTLARPGRTARCAVGTVATLSGQWQTREGGTVDRYIQTDALMRPGYSGGLVLDAHGMGVGMLTAGLLNRDHVVVPVNTIERSVRAILNAAAQALEELAEGAEPEPPLVEDPRQDAPSD